MQMHMSQGGDHVNRFHWILDTLMYVINHIYMYHIAILYTSNKNIYISIERTVCMHAIMYRVEYCIIMYRMICWVRSTWLCYYYYYYYYYYCHRYIPQLVVSTLWYLIMTITLHVIIVINYNTTCSIPPNTSPLTLNYSSYQDYITLILISSYKIFTIFHSLAQSQTRSLSAVHQLV